jgi:hypothetical protein
MNVVAWVLGALSLAVGVVAKVLPQEKFAFTADWTLEQDLSVREKIGQGFTWLLSLCKKKEDEETVARKEALAALKNDDAAPTPAQEEKDLL